MIRRTDCAQLPHATLHQKKKEKKRTFPLRQTRVSTYGVCQEAHSVRYRQLSSSKRDTAAAAKRAVSLALFPDVA